MNAMLLCELYIKQTDSFHMFILFLSVLNSFDTCPISFSKNQKNNAIATYPRNLLAYDMLYACLHNSFRLVIYLL